MDKFGQLQVLSLLAFSGTKVRILTQLEEGVQGQFLEMSKANAAAKSVSFTGTKVRILTQLEEGVQGQFLEMSKANAAAKSVSSRVMRQVWVNVGKYLICSKYLTQQNI